MLKILLAVACAIALAGCCCSDTAGSHGGWHHHHHHHHDLEPEPAVVGVLAPAAAVKR